MTSRFAVSLLALVLAGCNSGSVNAQQANAAAANGVAPAPAQAATEAGASRDGICAFSGWSSDPDLNGLNVRAGPSPTARIVGTLPPPEDAQAGGADVEVDFGATFDVVEARNGWFRIENARRWSQSGNGPPVAPSGWISGRFLGFQLMTDKAFAAPDPSSAVVVTS